MLVTATSGVVRFMGGWVRRADEVLAHGAAVNAASSIRDHQSRRLEAARTLHDLIQVTSIAPHAQVAPLPRARRQGRR